MSTARPREIWVDNVKALACVLVVLGHFFMSMVAAGFLPDDAVYEWFKTTIYTFHVPLFFICSGYLYQRTSKVCDPDSWWLNVRKKALVLGVPYLFFTAVTLAMKHLAGDAVNTEAGGWLDTLLLHPTAPYWYLYTLFFMFLVVPTAKSGRMCGCIFAATLAGKAFMLLGGGALGLPYCISQTLSYLPWFVAGMCLHALGWKRLLTPAVGLVCLAFLPLSVAGYALGLFEHALFGLLVGAMACACVLSLVMWAFAANEQNVVWGGLSRFTMPIYLMHTIFAAGLRVVLVKLGVTLVPLHVAAGLVMSFAGPVLAMLVMERLRPLDFLVYPNRYVKLRKKEA